MDELPATANRNDEQTTPCPSAPSPHARFPWAPALLCAACLAMAAWTWMRYSYCWDFSIRELEACETSELYVRVSGYHTVILRTIDVLTESPGDWRHGTVIAVCFQPGDWMVPGRIPGYAERNDGGRVTVRGRTTFPDESRRHQSDPGIILGESRFTGESVAGLVVGAMGALVFALYLRGWLRARRALQHAIQPQWTQSTQRTTQGEQATEGQG
jgi:hypothetical protein